MYLIDRRAFMAIIATLVFSSAQANAITASAQSAPLKIVATTGMIADSVRQVGGARVDVTALMGPGVDPHTHRQTRSDIAAMTKADAVFWHGLYLEAQLEDFLKKLGERKPVIALAESLPADRLIEHAAYKGRYDPHLWMDPRLWAGVVQAARDALTMLMPEGRDEFEANANRHIAEIELLAEYAERAMATIPQNARVLITAHDAFSYFGTAFGLKVLGVQGISTESEAGLKQVEMLVDLIVERKIGAIFVESSVSDRNVKALIEGAAAKGHEVVIGGELFSDAMGAPGSYEGTYVGMIDHNVTTIALALGGKAPPRGLNGRLMANYKRALVQSKGMTE